MSMRSKLVPHHVMLDNVGLALRHGAITQEPAWAYAMRLVPPATIPPADARRSQRAAAQAHACLDFERALAPPQAAQYAARAAAVRPMLDASAYARSRDPPLPRRKAKPCGVHDRDIERMARRAGDSALRRRIVTASIGSRASAHNDVPEIRFPEDNLRERFFADHPFELVRPECLANHGESGEFREQGDYTRPLNADRTNASVSGNDAVMRQLYLISQGADEDAAYATAVDEFHAVRTSEESAERREMEVVAAVTRSAGGNRLQARFPINYAAWQDEEHGGIYADNNKDAGQFATNLPSESGIRYLA